jgi:uncharacterized DUF497 family protein
LERWVGETRKFEWDPEKEQENIAKHKLSFSFAIQIWRDPDRIERYDEWHSDDEDRWQTVGFYNDLITVVYTERGEYTHIITAWDAAAKERRAYYGASNLYFEHWYRANT